jgi:hypothetical protein
LILLMHLVKMAAPAAGAAFAPPGGGGYN